MFDTMIINLIKRYLKCIYGDYRVNFSVMFCDKIYSHYNALADITRHLI